MKKTIVCDNPYINDGQECKESKTSCLKCQFYCEENKEVLCKCGKMGYPQYDNGLKVGIMCSNCFTIMVNKCRARSW